MGMEGFARCRGGRDAMQLSESQLLAARGARGRGRKGKGKSGGKGWGKSKGKSRGARGNTGG